MGIGDWGLGIGDWGLGPIPNPQYPIPNPQSPINCNKNKYNNKLCLKIIILKIIKFIILNINILFLKHLNYLGVSEPMNLLAKYLTSGSSSDNKVLILPSNLDFEVVSKFLKIFSINLMV